MEQGIEVTYEIRINVQEDSIKVMIELFQLILCHRMSIGQCFHILQLVCLKLTIDIFPILIQLTDIIGTNGKDITYVFLLHIVGFTKLIIGIPQLFIQRSKLYIRLCNLSVHFRKLFHMLIQAVVCLIQLLARLLQPLHLLVYI